jgi:uncharacterized protein YjhX (UPF0386 family)
MARTRTFPLNISKPEQRTLHALAQGGRIVITRDADGHVTLVECFTREGWRLADCTLAIFRKLKRRGFIASQASQPYGITREGLMRLRPQLDNRVSARRW